MFDPYQVPSVLHDPARTKRRLSDVEELIGRRLGLKPEFVRESLGSMLKQGLVEEDELVSEWIALAGEVAENEQGQGG